MEFLRRIGRAGKLLSVSSAGIRLLAEVVLLTADGVGTNEIMRRAAKSRALRLALEGALYEDGFDGLLRDKTRPSRIKPLGARRLSASPR